MNKIITSKEAEEISKQLKKQGKKIVLVGGCFDILHVGHTRFLEKAKKQGDCLFVFLESDESVRNLKGDKRPVNPQKDRAQILSSLSSVDYVIILTRILKNFEYDELVESIKPNIIAATKDDENQDHKKRQAKKIDARLIFVINQIKDKSTSKIIESL